MNEARKKFIEEKARIGFLAYKKKMTELHQASLPKSPNPFRNLGWDVSHDLRNICITLAEAMFPLELPDSPSEGQVWKPRSGSGAHMLIIAITNKDSVFDTRPVTVVYKSQTNGSMWSTAMNKFKEEYEPSDR